MTYDYIIAGAGLGGLSFVHHLLESEISFSSVLIIDQQVKNENDRTWSFWSKDAPHYQCAGKQQWNKLGFACDDFVRYEEINPYTYYTIHSIDFYNEVFQKIRRDKRISFVDGAISEMVSEPDLTKIHVGDQQYQGRFIIDSITRSNIAADNCLLLWQNFTGWKIKTEQPSFDPEKPILMDFRVKQDDAASFVYFLPYSETEALVEYTQFSKDLSFSATAYEREIEQYLKVQLKVDEYSISETEKGSIPMTNHCFEARPNHRVFRIGTMGGDTKPTTGYTFMNVQKHAQAIILILQGLEPIEPNGDRFLFYDSLLLQIMHEQPRVVADIMKYLFKNQPMSRVLKFLDEETTVAEEMLIMGRLPWVPFLRTLAKKSRYAITA
jgi:lycopene beta-cyclase